MKNSRLLAIFLIVFVDLLGFILLGLAAPMGRLLAGLIAPQAVNSFIIAVLFFSRIRLEAEVEGSHA